MYNSNGNFTVFPYPGTACCSNVYGKRLHGLVAVLLLITVLGCDRGTREQVVMPADTSGSDVAMQASADELPEAGEAVRWFDMEITADGEMIWHPPGETELSDEVVVAMEFPSLQTWLEALDREQETRIYNVPDKDIPIKRAPPGCVVSGASINHTRRVNQPLRFPDDRTAPTPGRQQKTRTGTIDGAIPNTPRFFSGTAWEYDSTLNGIHGCESQQFARDFVIGVHKGTNLVGRVDGDVNGQMRPDAPNGTEVYKGNTRTGLKLGRGNSIYFEGTEDYIRWLDTPGMEMEPDPFLAQFASLQVQYFASVTYDTGKQKGWVCFSGQAQAIDHATGRPLSVAAFRAMLNAIRPNPGSGNRVRDAVNLVRAAVLTGSFVPDANPEFRVLKCIAKDPMPATMQ